jgi:uncharacterized protein (DUF362 family)
VRGRGVILKPNLVEFEAGTPINTDPRLVEAAVEAFRRLGAASVRVAEGAGHRRDTELLLEGTGLGPRLRDLRAPFVDLNLDDVAERRTGSWFTGQRTLWLPRTLMEGDLLVSMPKLKTHHLAGATLSMKISSAASPGRSGWPKNVLHWWDRSLDCRSHGDAAPGLRHRGRTWVEGNGPIQGTAKRAGVLVFGRDPVAVDATCARLMGIAPERLSYLAAAEAFLGNLREDRIVQAGELPGPLRQSFALIDSMEGLRAGSPWGGAGSSPASGY